MTVDIEDSRARARARRYSIGRNASVGVPTGALDVDGRAPVRQAAPLTKPQLQRGGAAEPAISAVEGAMFGQYVAGIGAGRCLEVLQGSGLCRNYTRIAR